jgi:hypothetical protein
MVAAITNMIESSNTSALFLLIWSGAAAEPGSILQKR